MKDINGGIDVIAVGSLLRVANSVTRSQGNCHKQQRHGGHCERGKSVHCDPPLARHSSLMIFPPPSASCASQLLRIAPAFMSMTLRPGPAAQPAISPFGRARPAIAPAVARSDCTIRPASRMPGGVGV